MRAKKKPRARARGFAVLDAVELPAREDRIGEFVIQAAPDHVLAEIDVVDDRRGETGVKVTEVDVEVFDLGRPAAEEGVFKTAAYRPAHARVASRKDRPGIDARAHAAERGATCDVGQESIESIAGAQSRGAEPAVRGFAGQAQTAVNAAFDVGPREVAFQAPDERSGLVIVAKRAADDEAGRLILHRRDVPVGGAPAVADVDTGIEAGPVV